MQGHSNKQSSSHNVSLVLNIFNFYLKYKSKCRVVVKTKDNGLKQHQNHTVLYLLPTFKYN